MSRDLATKLIKEGEGLRLKPYECTAGKLTIGYGRNLDDNGITEAEANVLLENDIDAVYLQLKKLRWWSGLDGTRQSVLADMCFNLGWTRLSGFRNMLAACERKDYSQAAKEMLDSKWARQVKGRAGKLAKIMRDGYV